MRDTDARAHKRVVAAHDERLRHDAEQAVSDLHGSLRRGVAGKVLAQDREFVAAEARDGVARPQHRFQPSRDRDEELVAGVVAESVVHVLEPIEVEEQHRDL